MEIPLRLQDSQRSVADPIHARFYPPDVIQNNNNIILTAMYNIIIVHIIMYYGHSWQYIVESGCTKTHEIVHTDVIQYGWVCCDSYAAGLQIYSLLPH